ncbi:ATP-grasp domain-containing protein [Xanthobacteraceae bacterium A53D]
MNQPAPQPPGAPITVVVTAVGAIIGQGIVASLRRSGLNLRIIGVDRNPDGIGRHWCDTFCAKPAADEDTPDYLDFWHALLARERVQIVLPGLESDVLFFSRNRARFAHTGAALALNRPDLIEDAQDKWLFADRLAAHGTPLIPACPGASWAQCQAVLGAPPYVLKPKRGNGSRGIAILKDEADFDYWTAKSTSDYFIQAFVGNDETEYTVGSFGLGDGTALAPIVFRRKLSVAGNTQYAEVVRHPAIEATVEQLTSAFQPVGPTNYQFRMDGDVPFLLEINPRFSSSTSLRAAFGYNEAAMALRYFLDGTAPDTPVVSPGRGWRYYEDLVET